MKECLIEESKVSQTVNTNLKRQNLMLHLTMLLIVFASLISHNSVFAQIQSWESLEFDSKPKKAIVTHYREMGESGLQKDAKFVLASMYTFDENGLVVEETTFLNKRRQSITKYVNDGEKHLSKKTARYFNADGSPRYFNHYIYEYQKNDQGGKWAYDTIKIVEQLKDGGKRLKHMYSFDNKELIKKYFYYNYGELSYRHIFKYKPDGNLKWKSEKRQGQKTEYWEHEYSQGKRTITTHREEYKTVNMKLFKYDEKGDLIETSTAFPDGTMGKTYKLVNQYFKGTKSRVLEYYDGIVEYTTTWSFFY